MFALPALVLVDVWQWTPFVAILFYGSLLAVPDRLIDSARLDGASETQILRSIVSPHLISASIAIAIVRLIDLIKEFDKVYILTQGGPSNSTELISIFIWRTGFRHWDLGYAACLSLLVYVVIRRLERATNL